MGLTMICRDKSFESSYRRWNYIRIKIVYATIKYANENIISNHKCEINTLEHTLITQFTKFMNDIRNATENTENIDAILNEMNCNFVNLSIFYGLAGLYVLCNKADCESYYSVGNAHDIYNLLQKIQPYLDIKNDTIFAKQIKQIKRVLRESMKIKQCIEMR